MAETVMTSYTVDPQAQTATTATEKVEKPTPAQAETKKPEDAAASAETQQVGDESAVESKPEPKKADGGFQRKINKLTREKSEAQEAVAQANRVIQELQAKVQGPAHSGEDKPPERPDPSKFSDWDALEKAKETYTADLAAYKVRQELRQAQTKAEATKQQEATTERVKTARATFEKRALEVVDRYEGLDEAIENAFSGDLPTSNAMAEYIMEVSDRGPELVFALNANPEEAERISKLSPLAAAREMAKLEALLPQAEAKKPSGAPKPPKEVKGTAESPVKRPEDMSNAEYKAWANERDKKAGTLRRMVT